MEAVLDSAATSVCASQRFKQLNTKSSAEETRGGTFALRAVGARFVVTDRVARTRYARLLTFQRLVRVTWTVVTLSVIRVEERSSWADD